MHIKKYIIGIAVIFSLSLGIVYFNTPEKPLVSVVMLTYQRAELLPQSLKSILSQTYSDFELILINDGSTDKTDDVVAMYPDKRIRYYKNDKNRGIAYSRNRGVSLANGKYIMIMDDDDESLPYRIEKQVRYLEEHPQTDVLAGQIAKLPKIPQTHDEIATCLIQYNCFGNANTMYRRDFVQKNKIKYNERLSSSEDWLYWIDMLFAGAHFAADKDVVLQRNFTSTKYYKIEFAQSDVFIRNLIGKKFSPENLFYEADSCQKLLMIKSTDIFSKPYLKNLLQINCPKSALTNRQ